MVVHSELSDAEVNAIFGALADATRRDIVARVIEREQNVSEVAERYAMSFAAVQKHVAVLERASLVSKQRRGREQIVRARLDGIARARRLLEDYESLWRGRIDRMQSILDEGNG
jgi:DNA-binding transcriptional ArsR family regulator